MSTQPEMYAFARLRGASDAEAADEAGYSGRTPPLARKVYGFVAELGNSIPRPDELKAEHDTLEARAALLQARLLGLRAEMKRVQVLMRASRVVHARKA